MIDIDNKVSNSIECRCGSRHCTDVNRVIIDTKIEGRLPDYIKPLLSAGSIALVSYQDIEYTQAVKHKLRQAGYRITEIIYPPFTKATVQNAERIISLREDIKLIIGIGSGSLSDIIKYACHIKKIPYVYVMTAPSTDSYLNTRACLDDESALRVFSGDPPRILIADTGISYPRALIAAGLGSLYARLIGIFDNEYHAIINASRECRVIINDMKEDIIDFFNKPFDCSDKKDVLRLVKTLLNVSLKQSYLKNLPIESEDILIRLLRRNNYNFPSAPLISAYTLNSIYLYWLRNRPKDFALPPDRTRYYEKIESLYDISSIESLLNHYEYCPDSYRRLVYTTNSVAEELHSNLISSIANPSKITNTIRNTFIDKGYHIKGMIDYSKLMETVALAGELSYNYSLIKHIDKTGLLWQYVS